MAAVLSFLRTVTEEEVAAIRRDRDRMRQFFERYTKPDKVNEFHSICDSNVFSVCLLFATYTCD